MSSTAPRVPSADTAIMNGQSERIESVAGVRAAGPDDAQRVSVLKIGPEDADRVLILLGGREGAAGGLRILARDLATEVPGLQVWAVDRREQNLADLSAYTGDPAASAEFYLDRRYRREDGSTAGYTAEWGLSVLLGDVRSVVLTARNGGHREVILGGHSVGAAAAAHYAAWDFDGEPGYKDLAGLVQLDGGVRDAFKGAGMEFSLSPGAAAGWLEQIQNGAVFENATSVAVRVGENPEDAAIWYHLAARLALADPDGPAVLQDRLPEAYANARSLTNAALFGLIIDTSVGHPGYAVQSGTLTADGHWQDGGPSPLARVAEVHAGSPSGAFVWYTLNRVMLDYVAGNDFTDNEVTRYLGLRLHHVRDIDIPLYACGSSLTNGTVASAAEQLAATTKIPWASAHTAPDLTHHDLIYATPDQNSCLRTLAAFLTELPSR